MLVSRMRRTLRQVSSALDLRLDGELAKPPT
jgi:hypothetical protein